MTALLPRRSILGVLVLALLGLLVPSAQPAHADAGAESRFVSLVNQERAARGLAAVQVAGDLTSVARRHSQRMADQSNLHHNPNLGGDVSGWQKVGENVGRGPGVDAIHQGFMGSPSHRDNILDADWVQVGVGVVERDGQLWVTEVFRLPAGQSQPAPEPEPEPEPEPAAPEPAPEPDRGPEDPADTSPPTPEPTADEPAEPVEQGPRHDVVDRPVPLDRGLLTLARLEAIEQGASISVALD